jgi:hypothetical protein
MNSKMKTLSLAVLGLVGFGAAGAAMAQCPASLSPPWSAVLQTGAGSTASSVAGGFDSTACKLQAAIGQNTNANGKAAVLDQTPANETRYRAQFIIDASGIGLNQSNRAAIAFNVIGGTAAPGGTSNMLQVFLRGNGTGNALRFLVGDTAQASFYRTIDVALPNQAGANRVEVDLTVANGTGSLRYWVTDAATSTTDGAPTGTSTNLANSGWTGVDQITLGLGGASGAWRANFTSTSFVFFDQFDSRRQTFIGH